MIVCEIEDCATEWFHTDCFMIDTIPRGKWYCPDWKASKIQPKESICWYEVKLNCLFYYQNFYDHRYHES